jgi:Uma2 family endonuclease
VEKRKSEMTRDGGYTSLDLESMPDDGNRYEIIDGEIYVSQHPHFYHQLVCTNIVFELRVRSNQTGNGHPVIAPGLIFSDHDDVAPDVVWISGARLRTALWEDGYLHTAPEIIVEVSSSGDPNYRRDRETKLKLYSRRGVDEYWIVDWELRVMEVYRRNHAQLELAAALGEGDSLDSPLLPGFSCQMESIFYRVGSERGGIE